MRKLATLFFSIVLLSSLTLSQQKKNPVLEYCTGTWCQWCPCGETTILNSILPNVPNAIMLAYHGPANGSDPMSFFPGNSIIVTLLKQADGYTYYPTGTINRTNAPVDYESWLSPMQANALMDATVDILTLKEYNESTRLLKTNITFRSLQELTGEFKYNLILTEDSLIYSQTGNTTCRGSSTFQHDFVVKSMVNGALGESVVNGTWSNGQTFTKTFEYTIPSNININISKAHIVVFVYKVNAAALNRSEIQQAMEYDLMGNNLPVELSAFNAAVEQDGIRLNWTTCSEINNYGFEVQKSDDGENFFALGFVKGAGSSTEIINYSYKENFKSNKAENFYYRLKQVDYDGHTNYSSIINVGFDIPTAFSLGQNYPNPFNPATTINYRIPEISNVELSVVDILGNRVALLVNEVKAAGNYDVTFDASNLPSGVYFYQIKTDNYTNIKKMMLLK